MQTFRPLCAIAALAVSVTWAQQANAQPDPRAPELLAPESGFRLSQPVNGWTFVWKAPAGLPEAKEYELWVGVRGVRKPLVDQLLEKTAFTFTSQNPAAIPSARRVGTRN